MALRAGVSRRKDATTSILGYYGDPAIRGSRLQDSWQPCPRYASSELLEVCSAKWKSDLIVAVVAARRFFRIRRRPVSTMPQDTRLRFRCSRCSIWVCMRKQVAGKVRVWITEPPMTGYAGARSYDVINTPQNSNVASPRVVATSTNAGYVAMWLYSAYAKCSRTPEDWLGPGAGQGERLWCIDRVNEHTPHRNRNQLPRQPSYDFETS